eukprot:TRINITY_DN2594_c0_g1_i1.p1 TRINITY_DN2594_c0_g1~~TRINITY_DN2594_c0_g1_i1.p1  ORF type:complete len:509 (+),score=29.35 TRINITY_DN2594_c0_g1_i1:71-1528(+)
MDEEVCAEFTADMIRLAAADPADHAPPTEPPTGRNATAREDSDSDGSEPRQFNFGMEQPTVAPAGEACTADNPFGLLPLRVGAEPTIEHVPVLEQPTVAPVEQPTVAPAGEACTADNPFGLLPLRVGAEPTIEHVPVPDEACSPPNLRVACGAEPAMVAPVGNVRRPAPDISLLNASSTSLYLGYGRVPVLRVGSNGDRTAETMYHRMDIVLGRVLGGGGQGEVRQVQYARTGEILALKIFRIGSDEMSMKAARSEIAHVYMPPHPNLVTSLKVYFKNGELSVLMEYMRYGSLFQLLRDSQTTGVHITQPVLAAVAVQVLRGLDFLKREEVLHRDLKPGNILVSDQGCVKIGDFGICKPVPAQGSTRTTLGTEGFKAPERVLQGQYSYAGDIWSLGIVILEMAAITQRNGRVNWTTTLRDGTQPGPEMRDFVTKCLHTNQSLRATAADLLAHPFVAVHSPEHTVAQWARKIRLTLRSAPASQPTR